MEMNCPGCVSIKYEVGQELRGEKGVNSWKSSGEI